MMPAGFLSLLHQVRGSNMNTQEDRFAKYGEFLSLLHQVRGSNSMTKGWSYSNEEFLSLLHQVRGSNNNGFTFHRPAEKFLSLLHQVRGSNRCTHLDPVLVDLVSIPSSSGQGV